METEPQEKLSMLFGETQAQTPSREHLELISKWLAVFSEMYHRELSPISTMAYIEGLKDLPLEEIRIGCERALKEVDRMPTVAHIRDLRTDLSKEALGKFERMYTEQGKRGCSMCDFTGWRMIQNPSGGEWAVKCDCRRTMVEPE